MMLLSRYGSGMRCLQWGVRSTDQSSEGYLYPCIDDVQAALAAGERRPAGSLAGLTLHWGCVRHEGEGWGPPPAGWHTIPDRSFGAGDTWQPTQYHRSSDRLALLSLARQSRSGEDSACCAWRYELL